MKYKKGDGLDGDNDVKNTLPSHHGAFILTISKQIMNNYIREKKTDFVIIVYTTETPIACLLRKNVKMF